MAFSASGARERTWGLPGHPPEDGPGTPPTVKLLAKLGRTRLSFFVIQASRNKENSYFAEGCVRGIFHRADFTNPMDDPYSALLTLPGANEDSFLPRALLCLRPPTVRPGWTP